MIRGLFKDLTKYFFSYIIPSLVGIISIPIITRLIPPEEFGDYTLVLAIVAILSALASAWISASIIRFFPSYKLHDRLEEFYDVIIKLIFISVMSILLISLIILFFTRNFFSTTLYSLMHIGLLVFIVHSIFEVFLSILRAKRQLNWYSFFKIWHRMVGIIVGIGLIIVFHWGAKGLLWGGWLSMAFALPPLYKLAIGKFSFKNRNMFSPMILELINYGVPIITVNLASWITNLSDRFVINFFLGSEEVGIYSVGYTISQQSILIIAVLFRMVSEPIGFSIWEKQGMKASQAFFTKLTRYYLLLGLPAAVGLSVLSKPVMRVLADPLYFSGYQIIPLIAFSFFFAGITNMFSMVIMCYKKTNLIMFGNLFTAMLNLGLNILLIPEYGYVTAALTTFIAFAVGMVIKIIISRYFLVWQFPFKSLLKITSASAMMALVIHYLGDGFTSSNLMNLIVQIFLGVVAYFVMLILLHEFQAEEIKEVRTLVLKNLKVRG